jgi:hypothetical protein
VSASVGIADFGELLRFVRDGPLPDSCTAAKLTLDFDYLIGIGDGGLLGQSRFPKTLDQQLQICHPAPSDRRRYRKRGLELERACRRLTGRSIAPEMRESGGETAVSYRKGGVLALRFLPRDDGLVKASKLNKRLPYPNKQAV